LGKKVRWGPLHVSHGTGVGDICMDIDELLLLLFKRFSAVSEMKYIYFPEILKKQFKV
jgi:hypothetical protein